MKLKITIRLDERLQKQLDELAKLSGKSKSELIWDALKRQLKIQSFQQLRNKILPFAEAQGLLTDEDIYNTSAR